MLITIIIIVIYHLTSRETQQTTLDPVIIIECHKIGF
jgi:hypothetical protein